MSGVAGNAMFGVVGNEPEGVDFKDTKVDGSVAEVH